jgi:alpha-1,2-glucosyltransferase
MFILDFWASPQASPQQRASHSGRLPRAPLGCMRGRTRLESGRLGGVETRANRYAPRLPTALCVALVAVLHAWINWRQPAPYMDELFHVPQAQRICAATAAGSRSFEYDGAITTPPGPYLAPAVLAMFLPYFCTTRGLRALSALFVVLALPQASAILRSLRSRHPETVSDVSGGGAGSAAASPAIEAALVVLHPTFFFYSNLFYTDPPAILFLLVCWRLSLANRPVASAVFGLLSSLCRQTSAVFHAYIALDAVLAALAQGAPLSRIRRLAAPHAGAGIVYLLAFKANSFRIALGDHVHHAVAVHPAMFAYHAGYCAAASVPTVIACGSLSRQTLRAANRSFRRAMLKRRWRIALWASGLLSLLLVVQTGEYAHPFALADNRHYVFYVYRRFLLRSVWLRLALVPVYSAAFVSPFLHLALLGDMARAALEKRVCPSALARSGLSNWLAAELFSEASLLLAVALCVVPATLLEPRYFVPGFLITLLRACSRATLRRTETTVSVALLVVVNVSLVFIFCERPFERAADRHMPGDQSLGRFMF